MSDFYLIDGVEYPRVTSILKVIDKSGPLMGWATRLEREAMRAALEDVLTEPGIQGADAIFERAMRLIGGKRAWIRESDRARDIGSEAHALIEWHVHQMLGWPQGDEPKVSDPALQAVMNWLDWCRQVAFTPLEAERTVYCPACGFAGTLDCIAKVLGQVLLIDWKSGKAVYPEAYLQNIAYRHAAAREGIHTDGGLIVRLPKTIGDRLTEAVPVPPTDYRYFRAAKILWVWKQQQDQQPWGPKMTACSVSLEPAR